MPTLVSMRIEAPLEQGHGVASWAALQKAGATRTDLRRALSTADLRRLRPGWYATPTADPAVVEAVQRGGVCSCVSALRLHGVWIPEGHSRVHARTRPANHNRKVRGFCRRFGRPLREGCAVDDVTTALAHAVRCLNREDTVVVLDSIMHKGLLSREEIEYLLRSTPERVQSLLDLCAMAEAGTESMARLRLTDRGYRVRPQVEVPGLGRIDLLLGNRLIIEVDGEEYHSSSEQFHSDRERDLEAYRLDFLPMRFAYRHVVHEWEERVQAVVAVVERGEHLPMPATQLTADPMLSLP